MTNTATAYQPQHLDLWTQADPATGTMSNYGGADLSDLYVGPVSRNRDNEDVPIIACNWHVVTEAIMAAATHDETSIHRFGHWAVGWYERILIHRDDAAALRVADKWAASLESYGIADEDKLSEYELEDQQRTYTNCLRRDWLQRVEDALIDSLSQDETISDPEDAAMALMQPLSADDAIDQAFWEASSDHWQDGSDGQWYNVDKLSTAAAVSALRWPVDPDQLVLIAA